MVSLISDRLPTTATSYPTDDSTPWITKTQNLIPNVPSIPPKVLGTAQTGTFGADTGIYHTTERIHECPLSPDGFLSPGE
jgi:hypothetical protein